MEKDKKKNTKKLPSTIAYTFILTLLCSVFAVFCVYNTKTLVVKENAFLFSILAWTLFVVLCFFTIWSAYRGKEILYKSLTTVLVGALFCFVLVLFLQKIGFFEIVKDKQALGEYLQKSGGWMPAVYIALQYLQVVILPIPSVVSTAVGVALFGPLATILYSFIGILLGSFTAFFIGRKLGNKAVAWLIGKELLDKWQKKLKGKDNLVLTLMFFLPMFPDDVLCFIAGLSSMSIKYFIVMISLSRLFAITTTCYSIQLIPFNTWWGLLTWGVLFVAIALVFWVTYKNMDNIQNKFSAWFPKRKK